MKPDQYENNAEGILCVYKNPKWLVCIKNWKPDNDIAGIAHLEIHHSTDEQFILAAGKAILITAERENGSFKNIELTPMQQGKVYNVPAECWFYSITQKDTKVIYVQDYSGGGYGPLKRAIRDFLWRWRRLECETDQIIITEGTHNGIELCALALTDVGDRVLMESPCYWGARNVFTAVGARVDQLAWSPEAGHAPGEANAPVRLAYFTGSHHYPLSVPTSRAHRQALCARLAPDFVLEDDYEFTGEDGANLMFDGRSPRHLLVGSFSKLMFPGLRLGYLVAPRGLVAPLNQLRSEVFREGRLLDQAALAQFIAEGELDAWYRRIQRDYLARQQVMHDQLVQVPGVLHVSPPSHSISLCVQFKPGVDDRRVASRLLQSHLITRPLSPTCAPDDPRSGLILGIGMLSGNTLASEAVRLRHVLTRCLMG